MSESDHLHIKPGPDGVVPSDFEAAVLAAATMAVSVLIERHRKYGPGNIARQGIKGIIARGGDKLSRLEQLYDMMPDHLRGLVTPLHESPDEDEEDAWIDWANYGLIALMYLNGWWFLPLK